MDRTIRTAALRAILKAERESKERYGAEVRETKTILFNFVRSYGKLPITKAEEENASLIEAARYAVNTAVHLINQLRSQLDSDLRAKELADLKAEITRLQEQLAVARTQPLSPQVVKAAGVTGGGEEVVVASLPTPAQSEPTPIMDGSLEDQILSLAGALNIMLVPTLIDLCAKRLGVDRAGIEDGVKNLVTSGNLAIHKTSRVSKNGGEYPAAFSITAKGVDALRKKGQEGPVNPAQRLLDLNQMWPDEVPLFGFFVEDVLLRHGYTQAQYTPEITFTGADTTRTFMAHAFLYLNGEPIYLMFLGEKYRKSDINAYYDDLNRLTKGKMYFVCLNARTARTLESDIAFLISGKTDPKPDLHIANIDDLALYQERLNTQQIKQTEESIWFGVMRVKK